jgi:DNA-binding MarR family transcriptional regulator
MEFFLLAVVARGGLHTMYELQHVAGLQPGSIQPAIRRLEEDGLLTRADESKRRRRMMKVTNVGEHVLEKDWARCAQEYADAESIMRCATLMMLMAGADHASHYLANMANKCEQKARDHARMPQTLTPLEWYKFMRSTWEMKRSQSLSDVLRHIAQLLKETELSK